MVNEEESGEETEGLALIDTRKGFNKLYCLAMLWTVRQKWLLGERFAPNCYWHEAQLVVCWPLELFHILTRR